MPRIRVRSNLLVLVLAATLILPLFLLLQIFLFSPKLVLANPTCTVTLTQNSYGYLVGRATLSPNASYNFGGHLHTGWKLTGIAGSSSGSFTTDGAEPSTPVIYEFNHPNIDLPAGNTVNLEAKFYVDQGYYDNDPNAPLFIDATCNASIAVNSLTTFPAYLQGTVQKKEGGVEKFFTNSGGCSVTGSLVSNANSGYTLSWSNGQRGNNMVYGCSTVNPNPALDTSSVPAFFSQYFNNADVNHSNPVSNGQINLSVSMGDTSVNLNRWTLDIYNSARGTKEARIERSFLSPGPNQTITFNATGDGSYKWYTVEVWEDAGGTPTASIPPNGPIPYLDVMRIVPGTDASSGGIYGVSGLRSDDPYVPNSGTNTLNTINISQNVANVTADNIIASGFAFTSKSATANSFSDIKAQADSGYGFIVIFAKSPLTFAGTQLQAGYNVYLGSSYNNRGWYVIGAPNESKTGTIAQDGLSKSAIQIRRVVLAGLGKSELNYPSARVRFDSPLGNRNWNTYGILKDVYGTETVGLKVPQR